MCSLLRQSGDNWGDVAGRGPPPRRPAPQIATWPALPCSVSFVGRCPSGGQPLPTRIKTLVMTAIPGRTWRGAAVRRDLSYLPYGRDTWQRWCGKAGVEFLLLDRPVAGPLAEAPPTIQRWQGAQ